VQTRKLNQEKEQFSSINLKLVKI